MTGTVDYRLAIKRLLEVAGKNGHIMYRVGSIKITHSDKTEHIKGLGGGALWGCRRNHSNGCRAAIWIMCSDGTVESFGSKGTIHQALNTPEAEYGCGVKPSALTKPEHFNPGTSTMQ